MVVTKDDVRSCLDTHALSARGETPRRTETRRRPADKA